LLRAFGLAYPLAENRGTPLSPPLTGIITLAGQ
jgi:hypothetical protein